MKSKFIVVFAVLLSLLVVSPGSVHPEKPTVSTFDMHGGF
jgi:hypothetical protein